MPQWVLIKSCEPFKMVCSNLVYEMIRKDSKYFTVLRYGSEFELPVHQLVATYNTKQEAERVLERLQKELKKIDKNLKKLNKSYAKQQSILKGAIV